MTDILNIGKRLTLGLLIAFDVLCIFATLGFYTGIIPILQILYLFTAAAVTSTAGWSCFVFRQGSKEKLKFAFRSSIVAAGGLWVWRILLQAFHSPPEDNNSSLIFGVILILGLLWLLRLTSGFVIVAVMSLYELCNSSLAQRSLTIGGLVASIYGSYQGFWLLYIFRSALTGGIGSTFALHAILSSGFIFWLGASMQDN